MKYTLKNLRVLCGLFLVSLIISAFSLWLPYHQLQETKLSADLSHKLKNAIGKMYLRHNEDKTRDQWTSFYSGERNARAALGLLTENSPDRLQFGIDKLEASFNTYTIQYSKNQERVVASESRPFLEEPLWLLNDEFKFARLPTNLPLSFLEQQFNKSIGFNSSRIAESSDPSNTAKQLIQSKAILDENISAVDDWLTSEISKQESTIWRNLAISITWFVLLLAYTAIFIWKQLVEPMTLLESEANKALETGNVSLLPMHGYNSTLHPLLKAFRCLVEGYGKQHYQLSKRTRLMSENMGAILTNSDILNNCYFSQVREFNKTSKTLNRLNRSVYKNSTDSKKAFVEANRLNKSLNRINQSNADAHKSINEIEQQLKDLNKSFARYELLGIQALTRLRANAKNRQETAIDRIIKTDLQTVAALHRESLGKLTTKLNNTNDALRKATQRSNELQVSSDSTLKITKQLMDGTVHQAEVFNGLIANLTQLGCNANAGAENVKSLHNASRNTVRHMHRLEQLLNHDNDGWDQNNIYETHNQQNIHHLSTIINQPEVDHSTNIPKTGKPRLYLVSN